jgi:hypothetical protein
MQVYIGYRHHSAAATLFDSVGGGVAAANVEDFDTVIVGSKIAF